MTHTFVRGVGVGLASLFFASGVLAQEVTTLPAVTITASSNVNKKVTDAFKTSFADATNKRWYKMNKNYLVHFIRSDMQNKALFHKNGYLVYHIMYGFENNLPDDVRKAVKSNYVDYDITRAVNVKQDRRDIWVVNLETDKKLILVRVEEGAIEEVGNYDKSM